MNTQQLITALAIDRAKLDGWLAAGLPCRRVGRGRQFDADQVEAWLTASGRAQARRIVGTIPEAARLLGVNPRTLSGWFAGGAPGRGPGGIDVDEVDAWRTQRYAEADPLLSGPVSPALERYRAARAALAELELQAKLGAMLSIAEVDEGINPFLSAIRFSLERIQRGEMTGPDAVGDVRAAVDDGQKVLQIRFGVLPVGGNDGTKPICPFCRQVIVKTVADDHPGHDPGPEAAGVSSAVQPGDGRHDAR